MDKKRIGVVCICLNPSYWSFAQEMLWGLDTFFLKHKDIKDKYQTNFLVWSDIPENEQDIMVRLAEWMASRGDLKTSMISEKDIAFLADGKQQKSLNEIVGNISTLRKRDVKVFPIEPMEWPMPTLMRYHLFLQQEEYLKENFDYIFYIDVDMRITDWIGEEILGEGLTAAQHPMYALRRNYMPPYEPNEKSTAYIPRPGRLIEEDGKKKFETLYYAGGFQGGKTEDFIKAMKVMRENVDKDFGNNYIAIWNDESHWNRYLFDNPPTIVLNPSYIYPDSLVADYYVKLWGRNYSPKIMTLTKSFSATKQGGEGVRELIATM